MNTKIQAGSCTALCFALSLLGGCSTMDKGVEQTLALQTQGEDGQYVADIPCVVGNSLGQWQVRTPGVVNVRRSSGPLLIMCESKEWTMVQPVQNESESTFKSSAAKGAGVGIGVGVLVGVLAPITIPFIGPMVGASVAIGGTVGAMYGGIAGAAVDGASGAAFDYASQITVKLRPRQVPGAADAEPAAAVVAPAPAASAPLV